MRDIRSPFFLSVVAVLPTLACSPSGPRTAYADSARTRTVATVRRGSTTSVEALRLVLAPTGNAARYRVREQLVGHDLQNDAIGETKSVAGGISFDANGKVIPEASKFVLDAGSFVSDKDRRDGFVRRRLLEIDFNLVRER
jgi:hypothetical protein